MKRLFSMIAAAALLLLISANSWPQTPPNVIFETHWTDTNSGQNQESGYVVKASIDKAAEIDVTTTAAEATGFDYIFANTGAGNHEVCLRAFARNAQGDGPSTPAVCNTTPAVLFAPNNAPGNFTVQVVLPPAGALKSTAKKAPPAKPKAK